MANHLVYIVMDSCRFDSFMTASHPNMDRIAAAERRYSFASWTSPSHQTYLMGQVPHTSPRGVFASEVYKRQFVQWVDRLDAANLSFRTFVPHLSLPKVLQDLSYRTIARVSMPVLNPLAGFSRHFDDYRLMDNHNDFAGMVAEMDFSGGEPRFYFLNLGETHYPYMLDDPDLPRVSGVHGVFKSMDDLLARHGDNLEAEPDLFSPESMAFLHRQQSRCVTHIDELLGALFDKCPANTYFIVTSDHGELFGEENFFGHGPIMHEKCFEVPFLEGLRP